VKRMQKDTRFDLRAGKDTAEKAPMAAFADERYPNGMIAINMGTEELEH